MNLEQKNDADEQSADEKDEAMTSQKVEKTTSASEEVTVEKTSTEAPDKDVVKSEEESEPTTIQPEEVAGDDSDTDVSEEEEEVNAVVYYSAITEKAKDLVKLTDWVFITNELANLALLVGQGPEAAEAKEHLDQFELIRSEFEEKKKTHYEELNKKKLENLEKKKDLLLQFSKIISEENWSATKAVQQISNKWDHIKLLPHAEIDALNEKYQVFMKEFDNHKVDRLVKKLEKEEENLTLKLLLLDKIDSIIQKSDQSDNDFESLSKELDELVSQWRKVGRVPVDKNENLWDRFNKLQDDFSTLRFKHDKTYRKTIEKALEQKLKLIAEAEALVDDDNIADASRRVNKLHKNWKKTKNLPQHDENELWDKFKAATDSFNEKKAGNLELLREQEQENLNAKIKLIEEAKAEKDSDDYESGHKKMQDLMEQWKQIGPVPRKKSTKIWKKFKSAMDEFYEVRREHFKEIRGEQKENLIAKNQMIEQLFKLGDHEDAAAAIEEAKKIQAEFKKIGHVPIKNKNKIWKQYREACDLVYGNFRALGSDLGVERELASQGVDVGDRKMVIKLQRDYSAIKKDISKLEAESIQYEEAKTYFKPTNKGNILRDELQAKIDKAGEKLEEMRLQLREIDQKINSFTSSNDEEE